MRCSPTRPRSMFPGRRWDQWYKAFTARRRPRVPARMAEVAGRAARSSSRSNDAVRLTTQHLFMNIVISLDGDTATARSECSYAAVNRGDTPEKNVLRLSGLWFDDELVAHRRRVGGSSHRVGQLALVARGRARRGVTAGLTASSSIEAPAASTAALFEPFAIGALELANRVVMAPMTRAFAPDGVPHEGFADYYRRRAEGEVGLIVTQGTWVPHPTGEQQSLRAAVPRG